MRCCALGTMVGERGARGRCSGRLIFIQRRHQRDEVMSLVSGCVGGCVFCVFCQSHPYLDCNMVFTSQTVPDECVCLVAKV